MTTPNEIFRLEPAQAKERQVSQNALLLDVRGLDEFAALHADAAVCIPLPDLERRAGELPTDRPIICICAGGNRSQMAAARLRALGLAAVTDVIGGTNAWASAGLPVQRHQAAVPLERQVRGIAGLLVLAFGILGFVVSPVFFWGATGIGFLLTVTALLGICPMMSLLQLMSWNRLPAAVR